MNKRELEEHVLKLAQPLLEKLYGKFSVDPKQTDRPDAAIIIDKPHKRFGSKAQSFRVGIEITTVDKGPDLAYLNDQKYGRDKVIDQAMDALKKGIDSDTPIKKIDIKIADSYIYDGAILKKEKYQGYHESGTYREIILLCFSNVLPTDTDFFKNHMQDCTNRLLSKAQFPFNKVVFLSLWGGEPVVVYKKGCPLLAPPLPPSHSGRTETVVHTQVLRAGETYNLYKIMSNDPLITPRQPKPAS